MPPHIHPFIGTVCIAVVLIIGCVRTVVSWAEAEDVLGELVKVPAVCACRQHKRCYHGDICSVEGLNRAMDNAVGRSAVH